MYIYWVGESEEFSEVQRSQYSGVVFGVSSGALFCIHFQWYSSSVDCVSGFDWRYSRPRYVGYFKIA